MLMNWRRWSIFWRRQNRHIQEGTALTVSLKGYTLWAYRASIAFAGTVAWTWSNWQRLKKDWLIFTGKARKKASLLSALNVLSYIWSQMKTRKCMRMFLEFRRSRNDFRKELTWSFRTCTPTNLQSTPRSNWNKTKLCAIFASRASRNHNRQPSFSVLPAKAPWCALFARMTTWKTLGVRNTKWLTSCSQGTLLKSRRSCAASIKWTTACTALKKSNPFALAATLLSLKKKKTSGLASSPASRSQRMKVTLSSQYSWSYSRQKKIKIDSWRRSGIKRRKSQLLSVISAAYKRFLLSKETFSWKKSTLTSRSSWSWLRKKGLR